MLWITQQSMSVTCQHFTWNFVCWKKGWTKPEPFTTKINQIKCVGVHYLGQGLCQFRVLDGLHICNLLQIWLSLSSSTHSTKWSVGRFLASIRRIQWWDLNQNNFKNFVIYYNTWYNIISCYNNMSIITTILLYFNITIKMAFKIILFSPP